MIELAYFGGFTHTEIATMLDTPVGTIKGRMRLGLEKLRHACRREVDELQIAADALPVSVAPVAPSAALKDRIMSVVDPGDVYQVWIKRPGSDPEPTSVLWSTRKGSADVAVPGSLDGVEAVLVTPEPRRGSSEPTSEPVITVPLT